VQQCCFANQRIWEKSFYDEVCHGISSIKVRLDLIFCKKAREAVLRTVLYFMPFNYCCLLLPSVALCCLLPVVYYRIVFCCEFSEKRTILNDKTNLVHCSDSKLMLTTIHLIETINASFSINNQ
jgi:hypothetical protein